jgi:nucleoside-diphosphate-sugar epimerase
MAFRNGSLHRSAPTVPLGAYGRSKLEGEQLCREAVARGLDVTTLRGRAFRPAHAGVFPLLFEWCEQRPVYLLGSGVIACR